MLRISPLLNWYFGLAPAGSGEKIAWSLHSVPPSMSLMCLSILIAVLALAGLFRALSSRAMQRGWRSGIIGGRVLSSLLMLAMLWQVHLSASSVGESQVAVLLDASASMDLGDHYPAAELRKLKPLLRQQSSASRLQLMQRGLLWPEEDIVGKIVRRHRAEFYRFDSALHPLQTETEMAVQRSGPQVNLVRLKSAIQRLSAGGTQTDLAGVLHAVLNLHRGDPPEAVVVLTDGNSTVGTEQAWKDVLQQYARRGIPLIPVGLGSTRSDADLSLQRVKFEPVNFPETFTPVDFDLSSQAMPPGRHVVVLREEGNAAVIDSVELELAAADTTAHGQFIIPGLSPGQHDFVIEVAAAPGERDLRNNSQHIRLQIRQGRLKVLLIEQQPRWEFRHLKNALERDHDLSLKTILLEQDAGYVKEDATALARFPTTPGELAEYDVVLLGDLDWSQIPVEFLTGLPTLISERGAGLVWIPGVNFSTRSTLPAAIEEIFPGDLSLSAGEAGSIESWKLVPTLEGRANPIWNSGVPASNKRSPAQSEWPWLPPVNVPHWQFNPAAGATVILQGQSTPGTQTTTQPLLIAQRYGSGQVLMQLFDDSWRWRWIRQGEFYRRYWAQTIRFAAKRRMYDQLPPLELVVDRREFQEGDPVELRLFVNRAGDWNKSDFPVEVRGSGTLSRVSLQPVPGVRAVLSATLTDLPPANYTGVVTSLDDSTSLPSVSWTVLPSDREQTYQPLNARRLKDAARATQGTALSIWQLPELPALLHRQGTGTQLQLTKIELWKRPEFLLMLMTCLTLEWVLRRLRGVL